MVSYRELDAMADEVVRNLSTLGARRGDLVAVAARRSAAMVAGALGIVRAGCGYVALDPSYPTGRFAFMLDDCGARLIVESSSDGLTPLVRSVSGAGSGERSTRDPPVATQRDVAYVIYTSGSTGLPKGALVAHRGLVNLVNWHIERFGVTADDRASMVASPGFDASVWEMWPNLSAGASLHIPPDEVRLDPVALRDWLVSERITITFVPTALAERLLELEWPRPVCLRYLLTGGDSLKRTPSPDLGFTVVNNYGVTEGTVVATSGTVEMGDGLIPPIGRAIPGVKLYVVDEELVPVAEGEPGELLIGGVAVALGYVNRPELTAERFIPDHLSGDEGEHLYRTGDIVRLRIDGQLDFLGRLDEQVQIRGARVECGEVAAALLAIAEVADCFVTVTGDELAERELVAYVVAAEGRTPEVAGVRAQLGAFLPDYMIPGSFVWLDVLPVTSSGKVDRERLRTPGLTERDIAEDDLPQNDLEGAIAATVAELLGLQAVGVEEDFFLLGGHSLFAAQLIANLSDRFRVEVSLQAVFEGPSVRELAAEVERQILEQLVDITDDEAERLLAQISGDADAARAE